MHKQQKLQHDAMVYLCLSKVLLMFKHDPSHVMIIRDTHIYKGNNFSFYSSLQFGCYSGGREREEREGKGRERKEREREGGKREEREGEGERERREQRKACFFGFHSLV
jgi:hypothetical protein